MIVGNALVSNGYFFELRTSKVVLGLAAIGAGVVVFFTVPEKAGKPLDNKLSDELEGNNVQQD